MEDTFYLNKLENNLLLGNIDYIDHLRDSESPGA